MVIDNNILLKYIKQFHSDEPYYNQIHSIYRITTKFSKEINFYLFDKDSLLVIPELQHVLYDDYLNYFVTCKRNERNDKIKTLI